MVRAWILAVLPQRGAYGWVVNVALAYVCSVRSDQGVTFDHIPPWLACRMREALHFMWSPLLVYSVCAYNLDISRICAILDTTLQHYCTHSHSLFDFSAQVAKMLMGKGAVVNDLKSDGASPLFMAAQNGRTEMVYMLLKAGADPNKSLADGATPIFVSVQNNYLAVTALLLKCVPSPSLFLALFEWRQSPLISTPRRT